MIIKKGASNRSAFFIKNDIDTIEIYFPDDGITINLVLCNVVGVCN